ncbi:MAG: HlyD family efflux transporter periplasmic adaptor subunit [Deltaproteobacteria bacterium]|nr:HlyD family efflux transporter periplasmic adaptor subunit [Deltaproteobacteria bacterium]
MTEPRLKSDLNATREDKDGRTYYRLVDPSSGREYRLYEVEYFIAQMLDGQTPITKVAARARDELKFELSPNDLERFVKELSALGFLAGEGSKAPAEAILSADDIIEVSGGSEVDKMTVEDELERLVRSALLHVKQGLISQARDYFLAAKKYAPSDEKVNVMLNHLDVVGEDDGPSDIEYLWKQAVSLYPELTQEIGPPGVGVAPIPIDEGKDGMRGGGARAKRPVMLIAGVLGFGAIGFLGWMLVGKDAFNPPPAVETDKVRVQRVNLFFAGEAADIAPRKTRPLRFEKGGQAVEVLVRAGESVKQGQPIARLKLAAPEEKTLAGLRQKRQIAEKSSLGLALDIEKLQQELNKRNDEAATLKTSVDELSRSAGSKPAAEKAAAKKELTAQKKKQAALKKDLAALKKKLATPQKALAKQQKAFEASKSAEMAFVAKQSAYFLRAPEDGVVTKIGIDPPTKVDDKTMIAVLADPSAVHVRFRLDDGRLRGLQKDQKVRLFVGDTVYPDAFIAASDDKGVTVEATDADGELGRADKAKVRLVRETIENALVVPAAARVAENAAYVVDHEYAVRRNVEWVEVRGKEAIARKGLQAGELVVVGPAQTVSGFSDERVRVQLSGRSAEAAQ